MKKKYIFVNAIFIVFIILNYFVNFHSIFAQYRSPITEEKTLDKTNNIETNTDVDDANNLLIELLKNMILMSERIEQRQLISPPSSPSSNLSSNRRSPLSMTISPHISPSKKSNKKTKKNPSPSSDNPSDKPSKPSDFVYYPQCGGSFDNEPLPLGCNICKAGCGPTTAAMIIASYVDKSVNPITMVDFFKKKGYYLGCDGSRYSELKMALMSFGLKTTDYFVSSYGNPQTIDQVAEEMKNYLKNGWTIFALANFCEGGCGHYFWIVDITNNNDTWAYDPYYGRLQEPPYNEKSRYPFPKYKIAFGVRKKK